MKDEIVWIDAVEKPNVGEDNNKSIVWVKSLDEFEWYLNQPTQLPTDISIGEEIGNGKNAMDVIRKLLSLLRNLKVRTVPNCVLHYDNEEMEKSCETVISEYKKQCKNY